MATAALPKTYLQQCVQEQAPSHLAALQSQSSLWNAAAVSTYVAYIVLTLGGIATSAIFAPIFLPIISITSLFLLQYVKKAHDTFDGWSEDASARVKQIKMISAELRRLHSATPKQLQENLRQKGIPDVSNPASLKPLIARHSFWEKHIQKLEEKGRATLTEAAQLSKKSYAENKSEIHKLRCAALDIEKDRIEARIKNAFVNAVIRRPKFAGNLETLGRFSEVSAQERAIGNANQVSMEKFFLFKNKKIKPITVDEAKNLPISKLAIRMMPALKQR
jgi:hypothetical protein